MKTYKGRRHRVLNKATAILYFSLRFVERHHAGYIVDVKGCIAGSSPALFIG